MARVDVSHLAVDFPLYHGNSRSLKQTVFAAARGRLGEDRKHRVVVHALRDISFSLRSGDRMGIIGSNGAGKTTLLRALAGIYEPVLGTVTVKGSLDALLDTSFGMNVELTGRENIMLRGLYDGLSRRATVKLEEDVEAFAELGEFLDLPVRFYSSGMVVRLGFALATAIEPEILLMDEWFMAGDSAFMAKARGRLEAMIRRADILILSSHLMQAVRDWTTKVLWLEGGRVRCFGETGTVLAEYSGEPEAPASLAPTSTMVDPALVAQVADGHSMHPGQPSSL